MVCVCRKRRCTKNFKLASKQPDTSSWKGFFWLDSFAQSECFACISCAVCIFPVFKVVIPNDVLKVLWACLRIWASMQAWRVSVPCKVGQHFFKQYPRERFWLVCVIRTYEHALSSMSNCLRILPITAMSTLFIWAMQGFKPMSVLCQVRRYVWGYSLSGDSNVRACAVIFVKLIKLVEKHTHRSNIDYERALWSLSENVWE